MPPIRPGIRLIVPGNVLHNSGGNAYNAALTGQLTALGADVDVRQVEGHWPVGRREERRRLAALLLEGTGPVQDREVPGSAVPDGSAPERVPPGSVTIVDGLVASGAPEALEEAALAGSPAWILLHMPLADHWDLERRALLAAAGVICTSSWSAAVIRDRHGRDGAQMEPIRADGIHVALPGTDSAPLAAGSNPPHLVAVAALLPNKDQLLLLQALALLKDPPWTAALVGSDSADPAYAEQVRNAVVSLGLMDRVRIRGELRGDALEAEWHRADLSLLVSQAEAYGMVVTESLARGIPVVVREGTGAVEALGAGAGCGSRTAAEAKPSVPERDGSVPTLPGAAVVLAADAAPLAAELRRWLTEPDLRARWRAAALAARDRLPGWDATARTVLGVLGMVSPESEHRSRSTGAGVAGNPNAPVDSAPEQADGQ